uniref:Uncharacterized protein n=1 Tax=Oryza punctata TaxID=4537 RepID=A0A0E0LDB2_ORYPU
MQWEYASSFRASAGDRHKRHILVCHHGHVVLYDYDYRSPTLGHVVWDPITGEQHRIPNVMGALGAAAGGGGSGSFIVAFVGVENWEKHYWDAHACFYSSETGEVERPHQHPPQSRRVPPRGPPRRPRRRRLPLLRRQVGNPPPVQVRPPSTLRQEHPGPRHHLGRRALVDRAAAGRQAAPPPRLSRRHGGAGERRRRAAAGNPAPPQARPVEQEGGHRRLPRRCSHGRSGSPRARSGRAWSQLPRTLTSSSSARKKTVVFAIELDSLRIKKVCELGKSQDRFFPFVSYYAESFLSQSDSDTIAEASSNCGQFGDLIEFRLIMI